MALCPAMATSLTKAIARPRGAPVPLPHHFLTSPARVSVCMHCVCMWFFFFNEHDFWSQGCATIPPLPPIEDINSPTVQKGQIAGKKQEQDTNHELQPVWGLPMPGLCRPPSYSVCTSEPQPQVQAHCAGVSQPLSVPAAPACSPVCSTPHLPGGSGCPSQDSDIPPEPAFLLPPAPRGSAAAARGLLGPPLPAWVGPRYCDL